MAMKVTWRRMKWKKIFQELPVHVGIMKRGKQVGIWGGSRAKKGWFRRALRLDARRCGLPLRPSALHHSSCGLATPAPRIRRCGGNSGPRFRSRHRGGARIRRSRILALLRTWLLLTRYRGGPNASCPIPWLQRLCSGAFDLLSGALPRAMRVAGSLTTGPL